MLQKISSLWASLNKKKYIADNTNLITKKTTYFYNTSISTSILFFIINLKGMKLKQVTLGSINAQKTSLMDLVFFSLALLILSVLLLLV